MGQIYKRKWKCKKTGKIVDGDIWWIKYYRHGKPYRESTHTDMKTKAEKLLKKSGGEIVEGKLPGILFEKVTFNELAEDYLRDYRINGRDTTDKAERSVEYLKTLFDGTKAMDIGTDQIGAYVENRMNRGLSNATINRELAALKRMFRPAVKCTPPKVAMIPYIPMLKESNVRKGFFEAHEYQVLKDALPDELKPLVTFAYHSGWRKTEILGLTWNRVDLKEGIVRLDPGETKNEEGRTLYLDGELMEEMRKLFANRHLGCSFVFHRNGQPIRDFRGSWDSARIRAGLCEVLKDDEGRPVVSKDKKSNEEVVKVPTKIFHDFRRTAIRDMVRSGVSERVAMRISGHKTRAVFDRYNIVSDQNLKEAIAKKQAYHARQDVTEAVDTNRGEVIQFKQAQNEQSKKF